MREPDVDETLGAAFDRRLVARLLGVAWPHRGLIAATAALFPLIAAAELAQPYLIKVAIDEHILAGDWLGLTGVAGLFLAAVGGLAALRAAESYLMQATGQHVMHDLRTALFGHLLRQEAAFFDRQPVGRLMTRVLNDVEAVQEAFTSGLFAVIADTVTLAGVVAVMLWLDWRLALVAFSLMPVLALVAAWFRRRARDAYREVRRRLAGLNAALQESLQGMTVIQVFGRQAHEEAAFRRLNADYRRALFRSLGWEAALYASVEALGAATVAVLLWYGAGGIVAGAVSFGTLVAFIQYTNRFFLPIRDLGAKYTVMQAAMAAAERIFALLDRRPAVADPPAPRRPAGGRSTAAVEFAGVWFAYAGEDWVLRDCTFTVARGEHVAIVGATGAGKTTCARLLTRAYDVTRGRVLVEGVDVREWELERLRRHVGVVLQDTVLFSGPVVANLAGPDGPLPPGDLARVLEVSGARAVVDRLPRGLDEPLAERAQNLSHGQRQLLAIARALGYNPAVLVLDEATSGVDPESEALIRRAMVRLGRGRTTITIAHRLSTVQWADRILVLHRGRVHEEGRHAELVRRGGLYARLWELAGRSDSR